MNIQPRVIRGVPVSDGLLQIFDVDHGACALLTSPTVLGTRRLMLDCGHSNSLPWSPRWHLRNLGVARLDELIVTNYDEDHVSGFPSFTENGISIDWLRRNSTVSARDILRMKAEGGIGRGMKSLISEFGSYGPPAPSCPLPLYSGVTIETFRNPHPLFADENNLSLVIHLSIFGTNFLFPGDLECEGFEALLNSSGRFRGLIGKLHVLIASHHGRENGICPNMFDRWGCAPQIVVISDDAHQFTSQDTVDYYASKCRGVVGFREPGIRKVLSTRYDGDLVFGFSEGRCVVG